MYLAKFLLGLSALIPLLNSDFCTRGWAPLSLVHIRRDNDLPPGARRKRGIHARPYHAKTPRMQNAARRINRGAAAL